MNLLIQTLVDRLQCNDPHLSKDLSINLLPLFTVSSEDVLSLLTALQFNTTIQRLEFDISTIPEESSHVLESVLSLNTTVKCLHVHCSRTSSTAVWKSLFQGLINSSSSIQQLHLDGGPQFVEYSASTSLGAVLGTSVLQELAMFLSRSCSLRQLFLSNIQFATKEGLKLIVEGMTQNHSLKHVELVQIKVPDPKSADWRAAWTSLLQSLDHLMTLHIHQCHIQVTSGKSLAALSSLTCLRWMESNCLTVDSLQEWAEVIGEECAWRTLDLRGTTLGAIQCQHLGDLLNKCFRLQHLLLEATNLKDVGMKQLASRIVSVPNVNLRGNYLTPESIHLLNHSLLRSKNTCCLKHLNLSENPLLGNASGMTAVSSMLTNSNVNIRALCLDSCKIVEAGWQCFKEHLRDLSYCGSLHHMSVANNPLTTTGARALAELLSSCWCSNLVSLDVSSCRLGDTGLEILADCLPVNLQTLLLSNNVMGNSAALRIGMLLPTVSLRTLDVTFNHFNHEGLASIVRGMSTNRTLTTLQYEQTQVLLPSARQDREVSSRRTIRQLDWELSYYLELNRKASRAAHVDARFWPMLLDAIANANDYQEALVYGMLRTRPDKFLQFLQQRYSLKE